MQLPELIIAAVGTLGGGGILGVLSLWLGRQKQRSEESKQFRDELKEQANSLRAQIETLKAEIREKQAEMDMWKERYWKMYVEYNLFKISVKAVLVSNGIDPGSVLPAFDESEEDKSNP